MLPFQNKKAAMVMAPVTPPKGSDLYNKMNEGGVVEEPSENYALMACAQELIRAVEMKDVKRLAAVLQDAFECMDAMPHVEGPHIGEEL